MSFKLLKRKRFGERFAKKWRDDLIDVGSNRKAVFAGQRGVRCGARWNRIAETKNPEQMLRVTCLPIRVTLAHFGERRSWNQGKQDKQEMLPPSSHA